MRSPALRNTQPAIRNPQLEFSAFIPVIRIPQPDGSVLVRAGKPVIGQPEIGTREFAKLTGISQRRATQLCEEGLIQCRRKTPSPHSGYLIPRTEADRILSGEASAL